MSTFGNIGGLKVLERKGTGADGDPRGSGLVGLWLVRLA